MEAVIFIGIQASGKSSYYLEKFYQTHIRLNLDMLRTRHREDILLDACLQSKQKFVIDNTNPLRSDRKKYIDKAKQHGFDTIGYYFKSSVSECLERNQKRTGKSFVPEVAVLGTYNKMELPQMNEGFDKLYYVSIENGTFLVEEYRTE